MAPERRWLARRDSLVANVWGEDVAIDRLGTRATKSHGGEVVKQSLWYAVFSRHMVGQMASSG